MGLPQRSHLAYIGANNDGVCSLGAPDSPPDVPPQHERDPPSAAAAATTTLHASSIPTTTTSASTSFHSPPSDAAPCPCHHATKKRNVQILEERRKTPNPSLSSCCFAHSCEQSKVLQIPCQKKNSVSLLMTWIQM